MSSTLNTCISTINQFNTDGKHFSAEKIFLLFTLFGWVVFGRVFYYCFIVTFLKVRVFKSSSTTCHFSRLS